jgi:hypothetical protein
MKAFHSFRADKFLPYLDMIGGRELIKPAVYIMALSAATIRKHHDDFTLITDDAGKELAEECQLPYSSILSVGKSFNSDPCVWIQSKLHTYQTIKEPFVHFDNDIFLWEPLPAGFLDNEVVGFHSETFLWYKYELYRKELLEAGISLPALRETHWTNRMPINMAIFGGQNWQAINQYAEFIDEYLQDRNYMRDATEQQKSAFERSIALVEQMWVSYLIQDRMKVPITTLLTEENIQRGEGDLKLTHLHGFKQKAMKEGKTLELLIKLDSKLKEVNPAVHSAVQKYVTAEVDISAMIKEQSNGQNLSE